MKKIFQNKSFLKSIQIFLVCLVVLGGGFLSQTSAVNGAACAPEFDKPGLIPCGRSCDVSTTGYIEDQPCTLCHLILMAQLIIDFLVKLAAVAAAFFISVAGYYYIFASGQSEKIALAKKTFTGALIGFLIILISWIAVDSTLVMFGYIDPLENDEWHVMCGGESPVPPPVATFCGDGAIQTPNSAGFDEECDLTDNPCASGVCLLGCVCQEELKFIGDACDASDECESDICGTDADSDNYFSVALGHTGTCQTDSHPYTDCDDGDDSIYPGTTGTYGCNTIGACASATKTCQTDGTYTECSILPTTEIRCNGIDEDCDGSDAAHYYNCNAHDCCTQSNTQYSWYSHCNDGHDKWVSYCESSGVTCSTIAVYNYTGNSLCASHGGCGSTEYRCTDGTNGACGCHTTGTCYDTCCN